MKINVLLLEDVDSLGRAGDIVSVTEGHARNLLFPQGLAALADAAAQSAVKEQKQAEQAAADAALAALQSQAEALEGTELTISARVKEGDEIFGSIKAREIVEALAEQAKLKITPKDIQLKEPITRLESRDVAIRLGQDVEATIRVTIVAEDAV